MFAVLVVLILVAVTQARKGFGNGEQDWGYTTVREGAHMFWWLYYTTAEVNYTNRPLVVWLQGGPGASSTGYGNFEELGALDTNLEERTVSWVRNVNVLFVDNPVGTGFSYVESDSYLTRTNREIALDFVEMLRGFYNNHLEFISVPFYIVSESYGGKMATEIALILDKAIKNGTIESNFIGIGLGDSWLDPITNVLQWAPYLLAVGAVDQAGYDAVEAAALKTKSLFDRGEYAESFSHWIYTVRVTSKEDANVDFYNILKPISSSRRRLSEDRRESSMKLHSRSDVTHKLQIIMPMVKEALGLNVTWTPQTNVVARALKGDFMNNVTVAMQELLNSSDVKVAVYNGQLDLIVCTTGIVIWLDNLEWSGSNDWAIARRRPFTVNGFYEGYQKIVDKLAMFWVNRAGHMVPADNPAAMDYILRWLTQDYDGTVKRT